MDRAELVDELGTAGRGLDPTDEAMALVDVENQQARAAVRQVVANSRGGQNRLPASSHQASAGTSPRTAAKAIGIPKLKATPSTACGIDKKRFVNG